MTNKFDRHSTLVSSTPCARVSWYDYTLQVWIKYGVIQDCGHGPREHGVCCNARMYHGQNVDTVLAVLASINQ